MNTSEVLYKAADLIEERGWVAGEGWELPGRPTPNGLCLEGGILAATGIELSPVNGDEYRDECFEPLNTCPAYRAVQDYLGIEEHDLLYFWNDARGRTAEEVIAALRAAAVIEAAKETASCDIAAADARVAELGTHLAAMGRRLP